MAIVTISRQIGSGGDEIAARLAKELQFTLVDHTFLVELLKTQGLSKSDFEALDEEAFREARQNREQDQVYVDLLPALITDLAEEKNLVVLGRGGQCIFRGLPGALHVRVVASAKERARRLMDERGIEEQSAVRLVEESDETRRRFIRYHYGVDIDAAVHYDLVVNTDRLSVETATRLVKDAVQLTDLIRKGQEIEPLLETARSPSLLIPARKSLRRSWISTRYDGSMSQRHFPSRGMRQTM